MSDEAIQTFQDLTTAVRELTEEVRALAKEMRELTNVLRAERQAAVPDEPYSWTSALASRKRR